MPDLADLFPGFAAHWIDTGAGKIFARSGGSGPPLLLLHGYTETNVMWHRVAPVLAARFALVLPDLPGYGWSAVPEADAKHAPYDKRSMAKAMVEVMEQLGHVRFRLAGHDRGGRVAYRLALDHPGRVERMATLDIVPTYDMWQGMDRQHGDEGLALAISGAAWSAAGDADFESAGRIPRMEDGELDQGEESVRLRPARARSLSRIVLRSVAYPRAMRGLPRRRAWRADVTNDDATTAKPAKSSIARCWRCGAAPASPTRPAGRSRSGNNGRRRRPASRSIPAISSPRKIPPPPPPLC